MNEKLKQLRLARGLSLDELVKRLDYSVSKQAISKIERGLAKPSPQLLRALAKTLGVRSGMLFERLQIKLEFKGFRKKARLPKKEEERIKGLVTEEAEKRLRILNFLETRSRIAALPRYEWRTFDDCEDAANRLRKAWQLGKEPIADVTGLLEDRGIFVLGVESSDQFDGIACEVMSTDGKRQFPLVVSRKGIPGERQRLNLTHELGHILGRVIDIDEEKAVFRFGAALMAPADSLRIAVGERRKKIGLEELYALKRRYRMSVQALIYRLRDLNIINESSFRFYQMLMNKQGWKKQEREELPPEEPTWLTINVHRLHEEGVISDKEAAYMLSKPESSFRPRQPQWLAKRRMFSSLSLEEKRKSLEMQAQEFVGHYESDDAAKEWLEADLAD